MRIKEASALALAIATCLPRGAIAFHDTAALAAEPASQETVEMAETERLPGLGAGGLSAAALIGAGVAAAAALAAGSGGGGGSGGAAGESAPASPTRTLSYTSAADFQTAEYRAQQGLRLVKADSLYFNGHYRWYLGEAPDPAAGTGIGVRIAVADTGIDAAEGSTGAGIAIDVAASYDYVNARAGSAADDSGHGTHVAGIIAAPRNAAGMHGLAFNATVVNFKIGDSRGVITASDAQRGDMLYRAAGAGAWIVNNSWGSDTAITALSAQQVQEWMPRMIEASRAYVAQGGVVVFAAGNGGGAQPTVEAGLPHRVAGLEAGWLAVVATDLAGRLASYSNRCGVAAAWCLAAPGGTTDDGLYSMYNNGDYAGMYGTSMAAPHAAAALGALKSMFPNLSYLQIRDRLLYTANRSGSYADPSLYGQGLMDLAAASSPVGGLALPTSASASGATAPVSESGIEFPAGTLRTLGMQRWVLVLDNYQRAPFWVPAQTFFREATPRMLERQWASLKSGSPGSGARSGPLRFSHAPGLNQAVSADLATHRFGLSAGAGGETVLGSHLELAYVPQLAAPAVNSVALGYAADLGRVRLGLLGTLPAAQDTTERTLEASSLGSRRALGLIAQQRAERTTYGASLGMANHFERPLGLATHGAFAVGDSSAMSAGAFVQHAVGRSIVKASFELARHRAEAHGALDAPSYAMRSASLGAQTVLGERSTLSFTLRREWLGTEALRLRLPLTIAENGDIGSVTYALPYQDLLGRTSLGVRFDHALTRRVELRAGFTRERYGFGAAATGVAALVEMAI